MSQHVTINGKKFEPSASLAREFGYSMDYVSRLAREGKIEATRVGRQWFVEALSLKQFVNEISKQKQINREQLREQRKQELNIHESQKISSAVSEVSPQKAASSMLIDVSQKNIRNRIDTMATIVGSGLVMIAGLLFSAIINPGDFYQTFAHFEDQYFTGFIPSLKNSDVTAGALGSLTKNSESAPAPVAQDNSIHSTGIVVFDEYTTDVELERIQNSFSDEVEVGFESGNTGVITPVFSNSKGDEYQFLMVPVTDNAS